MIKKNYNKKYKISKHLYWSKCIKKNIYIYNMLLQIYIFI